MLVYDCLFQYYLQITRPTVKEALNDCQSPSFLISHMVNLLIIYNKILCFTKEKCTNQPNLLTPSLHSDAETNLLKAFEQTYVILQHLKSIKILDIL